MVGTRSFGEEVQPAYSRGVVITKHDTTPLPYTTRAIYVGGAGNITARFKDDTADVLITGLLVGTIYPFALTHIRSTNTTATLIVALD